MSIAGDEAEAPASAELPPEARPPGLGAWPRYAARRIVLRSGRTVIIRDMRPDDAEREQAFVRDLSPRSRQRRFMSLLKELPPRLLEQFTRPDPQRETVLVAVHPEADHFLGVGRFVVMQDPTSCEFAVTVADECQGEGLGRYLMERLLLDAQARGLRTMEGLVLVENRPMQRLVANLGFQLRRSADDPGVWDVSRDLAEPLERIATLTDREQSAQAR